MAAVGYVVFGLLGYGEPVSESGHAFIEAGKFDVDNLEDCIFVKCVKHHYVIDREGAHTPLLRRIA